MCPAHPPTAKSQGKFSVAAGYVCLCSRNETAMSRSSVEYVYGKDLFQDCLISFLFPFQPSENDQLKFDSHVLLHDMVSQVAEHTLFLFFGENSNSQQSSSCTWTYFPASIISRVIVFRKFFTGNCCSPGLLQRELKCYKWNNFPITTINHLKVQTELLTFLTLLLQLDAHIIYPVTAKNTRLLGQCRT